MDILLRDVRENPVYCEKFNTFIENELVPRLLQGDNDGRQEVNRLRRNNNRNNNRNKKATHVARKRFTFARTQDMFKNCPSKLAQMVISGAQNMGESAAETPSGEVIGRFYEGLWGVEGPAVNIPVGNILPTPLPMAFSNITVGDISRRISRIKKDSTCGLYKIKKCHLQKSGVKEILAKLFNALLFAGYYPASWKANRTTLIPKAGKDLTKIENWRPITIGSMIARVLSGIIDSKFRNIVTQSSRQKGFTNENGCKHNSILLDRVLSHMKAEGGGVITIVDISKAFDTVPHSAIRSCLLRKGVPQEAAEYIVKMYDGCTTAIKASDGSGPTVGLRRGVKQGDPLSPMIFNLAVEPIIDEICRATRGVSMGDVNVALFAFADDMVLIANNREEAQRQLSLLGAYLGDMGMSLAAHKCQVFQVVPKNKTWFLKDPGIAVGETRIPYCDPNENIPYLGAKINPWSGLVRGDGIPKLIDATKRLAKLKLKPHQKIELLKTYVVPHFIHGLVTCPPVGTALRALVGEIRQVVKQMLHLPASTADGLFYAAVKSGAWGSCVSST